MVSPHEQGKSMNIKSWFYHGGKEVAVPTNWVRQTIPGLGPLEYMEHVDGVDWFYAPVPPHKHSCTPQTRGFMNGTYVERCACGAIKLGQSKYWMDRDSRTVSDTKQ